MLLGFMGGYWDYLDVWDDWGFIGFIRIIVINEIIGVIEITECDPTQMQSHKLEMACDTKMKNGKIDDRKYQDMMSSNE